MTVHQSLGDAILAAFKQAHAAKRLDVAEHLLRALEALEGEPRPGSALGEAYLTLGRDEDRQGPDS